MNRKQSRCGTARMCFALGAAAMTATWAAGAASGLAAEPAAQPAQPPQQTKSLPAGLRVAHGGNRWYTENGEPLCKAAGIEGHRWIRPADTNTIEKITPLLEKGEIDVFVWGYSGPGSEMGKLLSVVLELGPKHNPNFRGIYVQLPWQVHDGRQDTKSPEDYERTDLAELQGKMDKSRKQLEAWADEINAKAGKRIVFLVPLGDAMLEVRKMIVAGKFPGVTKQSGPATDPPRPGFTSVLGGDIMPHQGQLGRLIGSYIHFAAIYHISPEGLPVGEHLDDAQRKILQKLAWDMVSKYPYAGVAK